MTPKMLLLPVLLPAVLAVVLLLIPKGVRLLRELLAVAGSAALLYYAFVFFSVKNLELSVPWLGMGIDFELRLFHFSSFILLALSRVPRPDHALFDGQDEGRPAGPGILRLRFPDGRLRQRRGPGQQFRAPPLLLGRAARDPVRPDHHRRQADVEPDRGQGPPDQRLLRFLHDPGHRPPLVAVRHADDVRDLGRARRAWPRRPSS